jgi:uncharacterized protein with HEPN domain
MTDDPNKPIREAYADARRKQPAEYPSLPPWEQLPIEVREALIHVYFQGRKDALAEIPY